MPSFLPCRTGACLLLLAAVAKANAETAQAPVLTEMEFLGEMPVVLTVSRLAQPISEAPGAVTVIDRDMIRASGFREIPDLFRLVPGFYVGRFDGTMATVNHGLPDQYSRRMQVLVDGRSIYSPLFGGVEWADLPLAMDDIERIEVTRGPNAASYGANAFMGIINIITRHAAEDKGSHLSLISGNKGVGQGTLRYGGNAGNLDYRLTLGYREDSGFDQKYDSKRSQFLTFRGDYLLNPADSLQVQLGYDTGEKGAGFASDQLNQPRDQQINNHFEQIRWVRTLGTGNELSLQFYHTYQKSNDSFTTIEYPYKTGSPIIIKSAILSSTELAERFDFELQHTFSPMRDLRLVWGAGARVDQVNSPLYLDTHDTQAVRMKRLFGNVEWRLLPNALLNLGTMVENHDLSGTKGSPRLAINYAFAPNHTVRASVSKALRMPVLLEERADYRLRMPITYYGVPGSWNYPITKGEGGLLPEQMLSQEIGYLAEYKKIGISADFRLFRDRISDFISNHGIKTNSYFQVGAVTQVIPIDTGSFNNQNSATMGGTEIQIKYQASRDSQLIFTHSYSHVTSTDVEHNVLSHATPVHNYGLLGMHSFSGNWNGSFGYYRVGGLDALGWSTPVESYQRLDMRFAKRFKVDGTQGELAFVVQNLLDDYKDFRNDNVFDRRGYVNLSLDF